MSGGRDAKVLKGRPNPPRVDDYSWNGSARNVDKFATVGGKLTTKGRGQDATRSYSQAEDDYSRMTVATKSSTRFDRYTDRKRSEATGGALPGRSRKPISYQGS
jgi:hypothetical protein